MLKLSATLALCLSLVGCASSRPPLEIATDPQKAVHVRVAAVGRVDVQQPGAAASLRQVAWHPLNPSTVSAAAFDRLVEVDADAAWASTAQQLPDERRLAMAEHVTTAAADAGQAELLVAVLPLWAQLADPAADTPLTRAARRLFDRDRPAADWLGGLGVGELGVDRGGGFSDHAAPADVATRVAAMRVWLAEAGEEHVRGALRQWRPAADDPLIGWRLAARHMDAVPATPYAVAWMMSLPTHWADGFEEPASLRHVIPRRWRRGVWSMADPHAALATAVPATPAATRAGDGPTRGARPYPESLGDWADRLSDNDARLLLVLRQGLDDPRLAAELFEQADADLADPRSEHGGAMIFEGERLRAEPFEPMLREHDGVFYASDALMHRLHTALAHYHFHAQRYNNAGYAGPGAGDRRFVASYGLLGLVLTFLDRNTLNADAVLPGGEVVDLGVVRRR
jgi:hypothetical protein